MDFIAEQYRKMQADKQLNNDAVADQFIQGLYEHAGRQELTEEEQAKVYKWIRRKILSGSFRNKREKEITLSIFNKLKEIFSI